MDQLEVCEDEVVRSEAIKDTYYLWLRGIPAMPSFYLEDVISKRYQSNQLWSPWLVRAIKSVLETAFVLPGGR